MSQTHLLNDECRCHDAGCPERMSCLRWLARDTAPDRSLVCNSPSLFPYDIPLGNPCPLRIEPGASVKQEKGGMK